MRCDVFDAMLEGERFAMRPRIDLIESGNDRIRSAAMAAAGIGDQYEDALGHARCVVRMTRNARMRCNRLSAVRLRR